MVPEARLIPASPAAGDHRTLLQDTAVTTPLHLADSWVLAPPTPWWHRVWSGVALTMIIVALGTVMAAAFAAVVMLIAVGFQQIFA